MKENSITTKRLADGSTVAMGVVEITSIPFITIIDSSQPSVGVVIAKYKKELASFLQEVYSRFKTSVNEDYSLELLWTTHAVNDQPYAANIKIWGIVRIIADTSEAAVERAALLRNSFKDAVIHLKYGVREVEEEEIVSAIKSVCDESVQCIVKEQKLDNLQNGLLPFCLGYDTFPSSVDEWSRLFEILINHPNCAVSIQLMPVQLLAQEAFELDRYMQVLNTLSNGIMEMGVGNISNSLAKKHAQQYSYYSERKHGSLFVFNAVVMGHRSAATSIANCLAGVLATGEQSSIDLKTVSLSHDTVNKDKNFYPLPWAVNEALKAQESASYIWQSQKIGNNMFRFPFIVSVEEATELFRLPIGTSNVYAGFVVNGAQKDSKTYGEDIINAGDIVVGHLKSSAREDNIGFSLNDLTKHMLVVGTPGSGKTTFSIGVLDRLWKEHHIPFLVIEPAKNEYRALLHSIPDLQVFTPGKFSISPFVFNPFVLPKNVTLEAYKHTLKTAFAAAVTMTTPLDLIFEESINNCYSDYRWLDTSTAENGGEVFNIMDFIRCFRDTFEEIGYKGEASNIGKAGVVRLKGLASLFDNYYSIPIEDILSKPTVIELAAIENSEEKSLIISLLLLSILSYVNANYMGEGRLKNVVLIEEAHVLFDNNTKRQEGEADPGSMAKDLLKRMLAEIRAYGVGIIVADQSPRKVSLDVIGLTDMKVVFRVVESEDKQIISSSMNMNETQAYRLARLKPGEAFYYFNKLEEPEEVVVPNYRRDNRISITISDSELRDKTTYWRSRRELLRPYPECLVTKYCAQDCQFERRVLAKDVARRIFVSNIGIGQSDIQKLLDTFGKINHLVYKELNDKQLFCPELVSCVKVHLWRKIKYETSLKVSEAQIEKSLRR